MQVSIGIPCHNSAPTLASAMRSVFAQTFADWELLLMDDGSTDGSLEIARSVNDPRVRVYSDGSKRGLVYRLNQIAQLAKGRYLARMDADDLMHPERIATQVRFLNARPDVDAVDTAVYCVDGSDRVTGTRGRCSLMAHPAAALRHSLLLHPTVMGRTNWFRANPYDPDYVRAEDHELWCRTITHATFARLAQPLYFYREAGIRLPSYLHSCRTDRKILRHYGPRLVGRWTTQRLVLVSLLKSAITSVITPLGASRLMIAMRNRGISAEEQKDARAALRQIHATIVPGLDALGRAA